MTHHYGYRSKTRHKYSKPFRGHGLPGITRHQHVYKNGDYVTIKTDSAIHKGMPYHYYHGRTGKVFSVRKNAIGVSLLKRVRNRYIEKRLFIRVDHVFPSNCRRDFLERIKQNKALLEEAKLTGKTVNLKRVYEHKPAGIIIPSQILFCEPKAAIASLI